MKWIAYIAVWLAGITLVSPNLRAAPASAPSDAHLSVFLVTFGPGQATWERFGHDAIWIHDATAGTDWVYNYGMFDFEAAHFYRNFIMGTMQYWMAAFPMEDTIEFYQSLGRSVWVQRLNLSSEQARRLQSFLEWNALPKNKFYHYNYYTDNCATRVRDALDNVLDGQIKAQTLDEPAHASYRDYTRRDMADFPIVQTALEFVLGQPVDRPLTQWQSMYLPMRIQDIFRTLKVRAPDGSFVPLVLEEATVYDGIWPMPPAATPRLWPRYLLIGAILGCIFVGLGLLAGRNEVGGRSWRQRIACISLGLLGIVWTLLIGFAGWFLLWGEVFTNNPAVDYNENWLHFSPLAIIAVVTIPFMLAGRRRVQRMGLVIACLIVLSGLVGLVLKSLPMFNQSNWTMIAMTLPANIGLLHALWRQYRLNARPHGSVADPD